MRLMLRAGAFAALAFLLNGCVSTSLEAVSDFDTKFAFDEVRSFAILPIDRTSAAEKLISDMQVDRINEALTRELETRGYSVVADRETADVYLAWHLVTREKTDIRSYNAASAYNCWRCGPPVSDVSVRQFVQGTFIVDLIDPERSRSVWRSTIQSELATNPDPKDAAKNRAIAAKAVLAPFPPEGTEAQ
ncbi:DUF4136 domain-containing protein [Congregibacter variabilis]|uniref:DUF4136 domain-containing protein n=1 Tax=Congregibacter variabilis TaxID=3081200 RepID=A0ABZ0I2P3_9GAMM|nr:DUF4136 domain-containing protein [Congregibacter sp. IMCC43200]